LNRASFAGLVSVGLACLTFAATDWYYLREQASGVWVSSATGDPLIILPALGIAFLGMSVPLLLQGSEKYKLSAPNIRGILLLIPSAVFVTLSTGWLLTSEFITPAASWWDNYGFPLAWRVQLMNGCPPWCNLPSSETIFNPLFFAIDCLFYLAIGYSAILAHKRIGREAAQIFGILSVAREFVKRHGRLSRRTLSLAMVAIISLTTLEAALLWTTAAPSSCGSGCQPHGLLSMDSFRANSPTNMTLKVRNYGSVNSTLVSYSVTDNANNQFVSSGWRGLAINPGVVVAFDILIDGKGFVFEWGSPFSVRLTDSQGNQFTFSTGWLGINIQFVSLNTSTALILSFVNTGPPTITFNGYQVRDPAGDSSNNTSWSGPTVMPGIPVNANIAINGATFTFQTGVNYRIYLFDTKGFEYTVYVTP
jgi:hypothetical protein